MLKACIIIFPFFLFNWTAFKDKSDISRPIGYFEFFIGDSNDTSGYNSDQKFKIAWNKIGISVGFNDYLTILPLGIPININNSDETFDKVISNNLGRLWNNHMNYEEYYIHGIEPIDLGNSDNIKNKLVSNDMFKGNPPAYYTHSFSTSGFTYNASYDGWVIDIEHGLSQDYPLVSIYDTTEKKLMPGFNEELYGYEVISLNNSTIRLITNSNLNIFITISG